MGIKDDVKTLLEDFETAHPTLKGKAYQTSSDRTWEDQLDIILDPKRKNNYTNIKKSFLKKFTELKDVLPAKRSALTKDQLAWWKAEIMKQAGQSPGFPHVGGKAVDISVKNLDGKAKEALKKLADKAKIKVLLEYVSGSESEYSVSLSKANVFHCYE